MSEDAVTTARLCACFYFIGDFLNCGFLEPSAAPMDALALLRVGDENSSSRFGATGAVSAVSAVPGRGSSSN